MYNIKERKRINDAKRICVPFVNLKDEVWRGVKEYPEKFEVSNKGRIRSLFKEVKNGIWHYHNAKVLQCNISSYGYTRTVLRIKGKNIGRLIHRLVAEVFIKNPLNLPFINHKDCNKINNNVENLEWCTQIENVRHAFKMGVVNTAIGEKAGKAKLKEHEVKQIFYSKEKKSLLAKKYKVSHSAIRSIKTGKSWKHLGLTLCMITA